jgi:formylglycine-generating enzyme required for sulfatase activity
MLARDPVARFSDGRSALAALEEVAAALPPQRGTAGGAGRQASETAPPLVALPRVGRRASIGAIATALAGLIAATGALRLRSPRSGQLEPAVALAGMAWLPGEDFTMGSTRAEIAAACASLGSACRLPALEREQPAHGVSLSPYYLDLREVTNGEFALWLNSAAPWPTVDPDPQIHERVLVHDSAGTLLANLHAGRSGIVHDGTAFRVREGYGNRAIVQVTWDGARMYCATQGKRLPTEAEWEYAARGTTGRPYPWGSEAPRCDGVVYSRHAGGRCQELGAGAVDVDDGPQDRSPDGIRGLGGNVAEWVFDAFEQPVHPACGACRDPRVDVTRAGPEQQRVYRGGSWGATAFTRSTARGHWSRIDTADNIGFRCAADDPRVKQEVP